ncbi:DUF3102 domain-containing protein [Scytonema hofmannii FACHB-248]|uniref:DUF3102 domain-containing protein n=1 Tax=Scytonema hofmannii FACHB-248 TaxID=1842502 RepID=A0ABR8GUH1_9CYAN|nr:MULTISPECIES: DUF3102 domain-containing protein [Nostocales]MBD2606591.1 DUF3102 domain-containing protein [Scytonema hofmannii FACHB-248]
MNSGASPSKTLEHLSNQETPNFDYGALETKNRMIVQQVTCEIKTLMRRNAQDIIDIGRKLIEVKQCLGHGSFINWLKSEFHWSISTATKFMQVWEQFKFVNFTNLNITASALYLIAAPSTPKDAREEVLKRASLGENISYSKAKVIVCQHQKSAKLKPDKAVTVKVSAKTKKSKFSKSIEPLQYKTLTAFSAPEDLTQTEAEIKTCSLSSKDVLQSAAVEDEQIVTNNKDVSDDTTQISTSILNLTAISQEILDAVLTEMAISINNLTPEQLALVITKSVNNGLSKHHLEAIITASQHALSIGSNINLI